MVTIFLIFFIYGFWDLKIFLEKKSRIFFFKLLKQRLNIEANP